MTGMTPERLDAIRANLPTPDADLSRRERDAHDLLDEVDRLRSIEAGVETLAEWHETKAEKAASHPGPGRDNRVAMSKAATVHRDATRRLRALLNPTEGETDE